MIKSVLFKIMVKESEKSKKFWKEILTSKKTLTNAEAKKFEDALVKLRKEKGFREWS